MIVPVFVSRGHAELIVESLRVRRDHPLTTRDQRPVIDDLIEIFRAVANGAGLANGAGMRPDATRADRSTNEVATGDETSDDRLMTKPETAKQLGVSTRQVERLCDEGALRAVRIGKRGVRFRYGDVVAFARNGGSRAVS